MGRTRESRIVEHIPNWLKRQAWFDRILYKLGWKKRTAVQGAFNALFKPGLRKEFLDAYNEKENEYQQKSKV